MTALTLMDRITPEFPELFFGVVGPTGVDLDGFELLFGRLIHQYGYSVRVLKLSALAKKLTTDKLGVSIDETSKFRRIKTLMDAGTAIRNATGQGDALAQHAIAEIHLARPSDLKLPDKPAPIQRQAYLLRSLKHPAEVETLRRVYGSGFFLIALHSSEEKRREHLVKVEGMSRDEAQVLIDRDQDEGDKLGQQTRKTFALADVFLHASDTDGLLRFLDLIFGHPFETPSPDEMGMGYAYTASLRSAQFGRQVGAVIVSPTSELLAAGTNEVPKAGGGLYWPGEGDCRDHIKGLDSNDAEISAIIDDVVQKLTDSNSLGDVEATKKALKNSRISDLTEYGRVVHAEMAALLSCVSRGIAVRGATLFTTTFPCHNCAKHIVAAGIIRVVYVDPYPKSKALALHDDSIALDPEKKDRKSKRKVKFMPFLGIAPRRHFDLFSMNLGVGVRIQRDVGGKAIDFERRQRPRIRLSPMSYIEREKIAIADINRVAEDSTPPDAVQPKQ